MESIINKAFVPMKSKKGMTIIEILVSVILFLLCIGGLTALIYQSTEVSHTVYHMYTATNLAKNRIEWIRELRKNKGYTALMELPVQQIDLIDAYGNSGEDFERTTTVNYSADSTTVFILVKYKGRETREPVEVEIATLLSSYF